MMKRHIRSKKTIVKRGLSARRIGQIAGISAQQVNLELKKLGFLDGCPGDWNPTKEGEKHLVEVNKFNGYGSLAGSGWTWLEWDDYFVDLIIKKSV